MIGTATAPVLYHYVSGSFEVATRQLLLSLDLGNVWNLHGLLDLWERLETVAFVEEQSRRLLFRQDWFWNDLNKCDRRSPAVSTLWNIPVNCLPNAVSLNMFWTCECSLSSGLKHQHLSRTPHGVPHPNQGSVTSFSMSTELSGFRDERSETNQELNVSFDKTLWARASPIMILWKGVWWNTPSSLPMEFCWNNTSEAPDTG